jgi:predicted dehydrogenase
MPRSRTRRSFLKQVAALCFAAPLAAAARGRAADANSKLHIACVGAGWGGKGHDDMMQTSVGHEIVAICDIDEERLAKSGEKFPAAKRYTDWRRMLEQKDIDAVTISTPDHMHAAVTLSALQLKKHVYTQKPLTRTVHEARTLAAAAKDAGVVTQMGIQHHSSARLKKAVQAIRAGVVGRVSQVHTWTDRPGTYWKQGLDRPERHDEVPAHVHWNEWLGVAPERPFVAGLYHPFSWRGWWDFGTGALGDMGCHILDPVVNALELGPPRTVEAEGPPPHPDSGPLWCIVRYEFPGTKHTTDSVQLTWYEAGKQPPRELFQAPADWKGSQNGVLFVGEKGNLFVGFPENPELFPREKFADYKFADVAEDNHYTQWTEAILGRGQTSCPFAYSGQLTETVLLGNAAYRSGQKIEWDSANMKAKGNAAADALLRPAYRSGWEIKGLG